MDAELFLGKEQSTAENSDAPSNINKILTETFYKADKVGGSIPCSNNSMI